MLLEGTLYYALSFLLSRCCSLISNSRFLSSYTHSDMTQCNDLYLETPKN